MAKAAQTDVPMILESINELDPNQVWVNPDLRTRLNPPSDADIARRKVEMAEQGQLQPIGVYANPNAELVEQYPYVLIYGEHRLLAKQQMGETIRADVFDVSHDADVLSIQFMENDGRKELNVLDKLHTAQMLRDKGMKQDQIGGMLRMSKGNVSELLKLEKLPDAAKALFAKGKLNKDQGLALLTVSSKKWDKICEMIEKGERSWTAEQLREYATQNPVEEGDKPVKKKVKKKKNGQVGGRQRKIPAVLEAITNTQKMGGKVCDVLVPLGEVIDRLEAFILNTDESLVMTDLFGDIVEKYKNAAAKKKAKAA
jgi:ParB/RepB/Spo0J family partition protein